MRLQRRGLINGYVKVPEKSKNGKQHLHVLFRGSYIAQAYLSEQWQEIHQAKIIDIRAVDRRQGNKRIAAYVAKYMSKANEYRYSWGHSWVWPGFVRHWERLKRAFRYHNELGAQVEFRQILRVWQHFLRLANPRYIESWLDQWEPSREEYQLVMG